jgi:hypothetical protein
MTLPCLAVQTLTDAAHQLTFTEVQTSILRIDNQDVLVTPALLLDGVKVRDLGLHATQRALVVVCGNFHDRTP